MRRRIAPTKYKTNGNAEIPSQRKAAMQHESAKKKRRISLPALDIKDTYHEEAIGEPGKYSDNGQSGQDLPNAKVDNVKP